jgi:hypothetical protein
MAQTDFAQFALLAAGQSYRIGQARSFTECPARHLQQPEPIV